MSFCTAINCMDGRVQLPVINYLAGRFGVEYVDGITEPGPVRILAEQADGPLTESILNRVDISVNKHGSVGIAVVSHYDCTGNPADEQTQRTQVKSSIELLRQRYPAVEIIGLWVNEQWEVTEIPL